MSVKNRNSIVTDGLVFYVDAGNGDSYPGSGTTWSDLAGSNNGTLTNGPTYSSDNGGSIVFDGANDYVLFPYNTNFNFQPTEAFTVSIWIKDFTLNSVNTPICNLNQNSPYQGWELLLEQNEIIFTFIKTWSGNAIRVKISPTLTTSNWHNIVAVYDGSCPTNSTDAANSVKFYINSALDNTSQGVRNGVEGFDSSSEAITYSSNNNRLNIGERGTGASYAINYLGKGTAYSLHNRALTSAEVLQNYNALKNRFI